MRSLILVFALLVFAAPATRAAQPTDPKLQEALSAWVTNGIEAGLVTLYSDRPEFAAEFRDDLLSATRRLGAIVDTEVVAVQPVSSRVTRYYVAVYYQRRPIWLRLERYNNGEKVTYLPLRFSLKHEEILPGYLTEFRVP
jgi:hypothetical protein